MSQLEKHIQKETKKAGLDGNFPGRKTSILTQQWTNSTAALISTIFISRPIEITRIDIASRLHGTRKRRLNRATRSFASFQTLPIQFSQLRSTKKISTSHLRQRIDEVSPRVQKDLNKGVYAAGLAQNQEAYDKAVVIVFEALNRLEQLVHSNGGPYILGDTLTELDLLAYPTLIRFDVVYHEHFKCNLGSIRHNYPVLNNYLKSLYWNVPGFKETTNFKHIKENVSCCLFNMF